MMKELFSCQRIVFQFITEPTLFFRRTLVLLDKYFAFDIYFIAQMWLFFFYWTFQTRPKPPEPTWQRNLQSLRFLSFGQIGSHSKGVETYELLLELKAVWQAFYLTDFLLIRFLGVATAILQFLRDYPFLGEMRMPVVLGTYILSANLRLILSFFQLTLKKRLAVEVFFFFFSWTFLSIFYLNQLLFYNLRI